uniref:Uncharacterized protein n=1 Tax=Anguilla anguilla TaxID=7936 RepID=A0A0E9QDI2_ANGAN
MKKKNKQQTIYTCTDLQ